jgi:hypothetical protein
MTNPPEQLTIDEQLETFDEWVRGLPTGDDVQGDEEPEPVTEPLLGLAEVDFSTPLTTMSEEGRADPSVGRGKREAPPTAGSPPCVSLRLWAWSLEGAAGVRRGNPTLGCFRPRLVDELRVDRNHLAGAQAGNSREVTVIVGWDLVADVREIPLGACVSAGGDCAVALDELHLVGNWVAHRGKHTR